MKMNALRVASLAALLLASTYSNAAISSQWANGVTDFSSQWSTGSWSAQQVLGAPDTFSYGDIGSAWAPAPMNGSQEFISLSFAEAVSTMTDMGWPEYRQMMLDGGRAAQGNRSIKGKY